MTRSWQGWVPCTSACVLRLRAVDKRSFGCTRSWRLGFATWWYSALRNSAFQKGFPRWPERPDHGVFSIQCPNRTTQPCPFLPGTFSCSCFLRCRSKLVCCPKHRLHRWHLNGFSLLWMFRTCRWRLEEMLNDLSQYLHLKNRSKCQRVQREEKKKKKEKSDYQKTRKCWSINLYSAEDLGSTRH